MADRPPKTARRHPAAPTSVPRGAARRRAPLRDGRGDADAWAVADNFPNPIPVSAAEITVFETYLGAALDALLREFQSRSPARE